MPPIRKGDGTVVAPKGISQVRTGDGRILFDGVTIPDSEDLHSWYDLSSGSTTTTFVEDLSGNGHDLDNGSFSSLNVDINGIQAGEFDGVDDGIWSESFTDIAPATFFVVCERVADGSETLENVVQTSHNENMGALRYDNGDNEWQAHPDTTVSGSSDTGNQLFTIIFDGSDTVIRENGSQTGSGGDSSVVNAIGLGSREPETSGREFNGKIGEIPVYPDIRTGAQIDDVESYLANKWNIDLD